MTQWMDVAAADAIAPGTARTLPVEGGEEIAVFRTIAGDFYALVNKCPHKHGPLSQGIVHGDAVTCPLHSWNISLKTGEAMGEDKGCVPTIPLRLEGGRILLDRAAVFAARAPERAA